MMKRAKIEEAFLECYSISNDAAAIQRYLASKSTKALAKKVVDADLEMLDEGINWFGSDFINKVTDVAYGKEKSDTSKLSLKEIDEILKAQNEPVSSERSTSQSISEDYLDEQNIQSIISTKANFGIANIVSDVCSTIDNMEDNIDYKKINDIISQLRDELLRAAGYYQR